MMARLIDHFFAAFGGREGELKRQADILKTECPLIVDWLAGISYFRQPIKTLDPIEAARAEGRRQMFLELALLCEFPAEDIRKYFND